MVRGYGRGELGSYTRNAGSLSVFNLTYDNGANTVGLLTGVTETAGSVAYGYDALYRLTSESRTGPYANSHMHGYDLAGNRTSADGVTATYDDANKFLQTSAAPWNGQSQYDSHGNVVSRVPFQSPSLPSEASLFAWDSFDQLSRTQLYNSPQGPYAYANYEYDGLGRRIYRWSYRDYYYGGEPTPYGNMFYIYDGDLLLGAVEAPDNGSFPLKVRAAYTWGAAGLVSERLVDQNRSLWYHFGPQGETRQLTNSAGTVVDSYVYTAYGQPVASTGTDPNPFRYGGQFGYYTDLDLGNGGLILCGARWYSPAVGRWLSREPIGYDGGPNLYEYCSSSPVNRFDPTGRDDLTWEEWVNIAEALDVIKQVGYRGVYNDLVDRFGTRLIDAVPDDKDGTIAHTDWGIFVRGANSSCIHIHRGDWLTNPYPKGSRSHFDSLVVLAATLVHEWVHMKRQGSFWQYFHVREREDRAYGFELRLLRAWRNKTRSKTDIETIDDKIEEIRTRE